MNRSWDDVSLRVRHLILDDFRHIQVSRRAWFEVTGQSVVASRKVESEGEILHLIGWIPNCDHRVVAIPGTPILKGLEHALADASPTHLKDITVRLVHTSGGHDQRPGRCLAVENQIEIAIEVFRPKLRQEQWHIEALRLVCLQPYRRKFSGVGCT